MRAMAVRIVFGLTSLVVGVSARYEWSASRSVGVKLEPFQIVYITSNTTDNSNNPSLLGGDELDAMLILEATRDHLRDHAFSDHPGFQSIQLFPSFRSDRMFENGTQVAFGGTAFYEESPMNTDVLQNFDMMTPYLCFLGESNETLYVNKLREFGWHNLERALLLTAAGERLVYTNGSMQTMEKATDEGTQNSSDIRRPENEMMEGASRMIYTLAIGIPLAVASAVAFFCVGYIFKSNCQCGKPFGGSSNDSSVWKTTSSKARKLRRLAGDIRSDESTMPSKNGDSSVQAAVGAARGREVFLHPALVRAVERTARVETV